MKNGKNSLQTSEVRSGAAVHCHISGEQVEQSKNRVQFGVELTEIPHTLLLIKERKDQMGKHVLRTGKVGRPPQKNPSERTLYMRNYMRTYKQKKDDEYNLDIGYWWSRRFLC